MGQLKKRYGSRVATIKEMFPDWTDEDIVLALQETDGDLETTVDRITGGMYWPTVGVACCQNGGHAIYTRITC